MKPKTIFLLLIILILLMQPVAGGVAKFIWKAGKLVFGVGAAAAAGVVGYSEYAAQTYNAVFLQLDQGTEFEVPETFILKTYGATPLKPLEPTDNQRNISVHSDVPIKYEDGTTSTDLFWIRLLDDSVINYNAIVRFEVGGKLIEKYFQETGIKGGQNGNNRIEMKYGQRKTLTIPGLLSVELKPSLGIYKTNVEISKIVFDAKILQNLVQKRVTSKELTTRIIKNAGGAPVSSPQEQQPEPPQGGVEWHKVEK